MKQYSISKIMMTFLLSVFSPMLVFASSDSTGIQVDTIMVENERPAKLGLFARLGRYLSETNKPSDKKFDMSVIVGPSYSAATSLSVGGVACGLYSWDRSDSLLSRSDVSIFAAVSLTGMSSLGVEGRNYLPHDKWRLNYLLVGQYMPMHLWGVGYTQGSHYKDYGDYSRVYVKFRPEALYRLAHNLYFGPIADLDFTYMFDLRAKRLSGDLPKDFDGSDFRSRVFSTGLGVSFNYDSRDFATGPTRGIFIGVQQLYYAKALQSYGHFGSTDLTFSAYHKVWKGGVLAYDVHGLFTYGIVPWTRLAQMGGAQRMRGYYIGQYRDEKLAEAQVELRQHVWSRSGIVVWAGCGSVWGCEPFMWRHVLPNFGAGYRWELKQHSNVRIDFGFTNKDWNVCFNINEAF